MTSFLKVFDPLYGSFELPKFLEIFLNSPEFRRLGSVRLLNFESMSLSALSEVRRMSHTLGVLHLGTRLPNFGIDESDVRALLFAIILHDIGTPPFAHTLEYEFVRHNNINHEEITLQILDGRHHKLNLDHQIYRGKSIQLNQLINATGVEGKIRDILSKKHPLSKLLFSDIDIDNIDNVFRMARMLGKAFDPQVPLRIVAALSVDKNGNKILPRSNKELVENWLECRKFSYRAILDTRSHRQNQAIFSRIVYEAMTIGIIDRNDWFLTDELLLQKIIKSPELSKHFLNLNKNSTLKEIVLGVEPTIALSKNDLLNHRDRITESIEKALGGDAYVAFFDYGSSISRLVSFKDPDDNETWSVGETTSAYRLHIFAAPNLISSGIAKSDFSIRAIIEKYADKHNWVFKTPSFSFG